MSCDNPKLGIVNNSMYAKYDQFFHKIMGGNHFWVWNKGPNSAETIWNMSYYNPKPYIANNNRIAEFDLNLSIISQNIEWILFLPNNQGQ